MLIWVSGLAAGQNRRTGWQRECHILRRIDDDAGVQFRGGRSGKRRQRADGVPDVPAAREIDTARESNDHIDICAIVVLAGVPEIVCQGDSSRRPE